MNTAASNTRYAVIDKTAITPDVVSRISHFKKLPNDGEGKTKVIIDRQKKVFWQIDDNDLEECRAIAMQRDKQTITILN